MAKQAAIPIEFTSTLTGQGQTTVPAAVRRALGLSAGDRLTYTVARDGRVTLDREEMAEPAAVDAFLAFLDADIRDDPAQVRPYDAALSEQAKQLTRGVEPLPLD